ncbi:MAG: hypothetical protein WD595_02870 [Waddliaceae bacterium]
MVEVTIEEKKRMGDSLLWELQNITYEQFGPQAWAGKGVPFYLTSNPYIAHRYANVILGYLRDCLAPTAKTPINLDEPIYIFDLGAGSGRFGYLCLKNLIEMVKIFPKRPKITYVMCDMVEDNIAFWRSHPLLKPYVEKGVLDFARYSEQEENRTLTLLESGVTLTRETAVNPLLLVCNYFFDTIPQDLFRVHKGKVEEGLLKLTVDAPEGQKVNPRDPAVISKLKLTYDYAKIDSLDTYYDNPKWNHILREYEESFKETAFLFPTRPLKTIEWFAELSGQRLFMIAGDQGVSSHDQVQNWEKPLICRHGSFSFGVSYDAIKRFFDNEKGAGFVTSYPNKVFVQMSGVLGGDKDAYPETAFAFKESMDAFEPRDYWKLLIRKKEEANITPYEKLLLYLKLSYFCPVRFNIYFESLRSQLNKFGAVEKKQFRHMVFQAADNFYFVNPEEAIFILNLGVLLYDLSDLQGAHDLFRRSMLYTGPREVTLENLIKCSDRMGDQEKVEEYRKQLEEARMRPRP